MVRVSVGGCLLAKVVKRCDVLPLVPPKRLMISDKEGEDARTMLAGMHVQQGHGNARRPARLVINCTEDSEGWSWWNDSSRK
jgi:hypothetical protein